MSEKRVIEMTRATRAALAGLAYAWKCGDYEPTVHDEQAVRELCVAFDAASDQPRIRWCVTDQRPYSECYFLREKYGEDAEHPSVCVTVYAIVVPLPEQP